jgi:hypothetical protein
VKAPGCEERSRALTNRFSVNGTVMNSTREAIVKITNHDLHTTITLDMSDALHPMRIFETPESREVERAGFNNEVWLDFDWKGPSQGDAFQPFRNLAEATTAVADVGVIKIIPEPILTCSPHQRQWTLDSLRLSAETSS